jgi:hypothetical protein
VIRSGRLPRATAPIAVDAGSEAAIGVERDGVLHAGKDVRPVFVDEPERVVVVTLDVYFNQRAESFAHDAARAAWPAGLMT